MNAGESFPSSRKESSRLQWTSPGRGCGLLTSHVKVMSFASVGLEKGTWLHTEPEEVYRYYLENIQGIYSNSTHLWN